MPRHLLTILLLGLAAPALADPTPTPAGEIVVNGKKKVHYRIPRTDTPLEIDGVLDEPAWERGLVLAVNNEMDPGKNVPAPVTTLAFLTYDDDHLYIGFRADDPDPPAIRAHLQDRDTPFQDDFVGVVLDTFNDERTGYELFVNPLGVQMDLALNETSDEEEDPAWDAIWESAGRIHDTGYAVEMAIPFSSLRFQRSAGEQTWGFTPIRSYPRSRRHLITAHPVDPDDSCLVCQMPKVTGFAGATPGRNVELDPTLTAHRTDRREAFPEGRFEGEEEADLGLTARWGITPNLTLSGAVNPDFSQVEADAAQLDINTQFTLFFPEKRPFFLEGADFFETPWNVVHTRTVSDPSWGIKLTGKEGRNGIGVFAVQDEVTNLLLPGSQRSSLAFLPMQTTDAALRYRRDFGGTANLGGVLTHREGEDGYHNSVYGIDGHWRPTGSDRIVVQVLKSETEYPFAFASDIGLQTGAFDGTAWRAGYTHDSRNWLWYGRHEDMDLGFRADLGFLPQVGYTLDVAGIERRWWGEPGDWYTRWEVGVDWDRREDSGGTVLEEEVEAWVGLAGPLQSFYLLDVGRRERYWNGVTFDEELVNVFLEMRPIGKVGLALAAGFGDTIDFANTRAADGIELKPSVIWNIGRHLQLGLEHEYLRLDVEEGRLFEANLTELRAVYQIDIRTFVRAVLQYENLAFNPELFIADVSREEEHLFSQLLFSYKINPRTVLFLGYSDNAIGAELRDRTIELTRADRTLFFKVGYALVL